MTSGKPFEPRILRWSRIACKAAQEDLTMEPPIAASAMERAFALAWLEEAAFILRGTGVLQEHVDAYRATLTGRA